MFPNIRAEMARKNLTISEVAKEIKLSNRTLGNKLSGKTEFTWTEVCTIRKSFFPSCKLEYLFEQNVSNTA